jgi:hypothetical protein
MKPRPVRRTGRAALAAAALVLAGCSADLPLSPAAAGSARMSRQHQEARQGGGGESRASIYVIGSGRSRDAGE